MYGSVLFGRGVAAVDGQKAIQQQILIEDDVGAAMRHDSRGKAAAGEKKLCHAHLPEGKTPP